MCLCVSAARREYRSRSVQPQSQRPPVTSQSGPILDSGSTHGLVQRLSNSQLSFNTSIASIFSQVYTSTMLQPTLLSCNCFISQENKVIRGSLSLFRSLVFREPVGSARSSRQRSISSAPARWELATLLYIHTFCWPTHYNTLC